MANFIPNCEELVRSHLRSAPEGRLPWVEVMRIALYEPGVGYYRSGPRKIGRGGDFYTSVSVGPLFGELLAWQALKVWLALGESEEFWILEQGAHEGSLAMDILVALKDFHPQLFEVVRYVIIEPDSGLAAVQRERVEAEFPGKLQQVLNWAEISSEPKLGLLVCNELLDAFPVHLLRMTESGWRELWVESDGAGALQFVPGQFSDSRLEDAARALGDDFPVGYTTEINLGMLDWLKDVADAAFQGAILLADYGLTEGEYHGPERGDGTLRRYHQHCMDGDVLRDLGVCDLTAHVNFTALAHAAEALDLGFVEFIEQGRFLSKLASEKIAEGAFRPTPERLRQFQALTHPNHLGLSFQVMVLAKGQGKEELSSRAESAVAARHRVGLSHEE